MKKCATCVLCEAGCGILVDVEGGKVQGVRGDPDDPISRGYVCPKVVGMQELHEDPDRLRAPLVRVGGPGEFREASWDEALSIAARGLRRVTRAHGRDALGIYQGNPTAHNLSLLTTGQAIFRTLGTKNLYSASSSDQNPHMRAALEMFGHLLFMPVPDVDRTDLLVVVGGNPLVSNGSIMSAPDMRRRLAALRARGGRLVVVDPRRTETAAVADAHLPIRPATDALFFFALLHVVFAEELARPGPHLSGVAELRALAARFPPERVAPATGIAEGTLRALAREIAGARRAACYVRLGTCHQEHATLVSWLAYSLAAVTGNLDREGGLMWTAPAAGFVRVADAFGVDGAGRFRSRVRGLPELGGELPVAALAEEIEALGPGQVRALVSCAGNPVLSAPNGRRLERALATLEHMVSIDPYVNETTRHAHVILPPCSPLERAHYDVALNLFAVENVAKWVDPVLPRPEGARTDGDIVLELFARARLGSAGALLARALRLLDPERLVDVMLRTGPYGVGRGGLSVAKLRREHPHGVVLGPLTPRLPGLLRTASGRVELAPAALAREVPALEATLEQPRPDLVLIGRRHLRSNNSWLHNAPKLVKGKPRCTLLVHPDDARRLGLETGRAARVKTQRGEVVAVVEVSPEVLPGVVSLPHGWGHHRPGTRLAVASAHAGVSLNDITDDSRVDRLSGNAAFSGTPVAVSAAEATLDLPSEASVGGA